MRFLNEYGDLNTAKPGYREKSFGGTAENFIDEYEDLDTAKPGDRAEPFVKTMGKSPGAGGVGESNFIAFFLSI